MNTESEVTIDRLVNDSFHYVAARTNGSALCCFAITTCADTVRITDRNTGHYIQRAPSNPLWKAFHHGRYICGMDTIHDAFRALTLADEVGRLHERVV